MNTKNTKRILTLTPIIILVWTAALSAQTETTESVESTSEGTVFGSMTVEAENKIRITFARPELHVDIDPENAPGLQWGSSIDILTRSEPDLLPPLLDAPAGQPSARLLRPWLNSFKTGSLAQFSPNVQNVNNWRLTVVDNRGREVMSYAKSGKPPAQLDWDGLTEQGAPAWPGVTYSYVFEAYDRAGNKRSFVGNGFSLQPYALYDNDGVRMIFAGQHLKETARVSSNGRPEPLLLMEVASIINQATGPTTTVVVAASARNHGTAVALGRKVEATLQGLLAGDPARIAVSTIITDDGPPEGAVEVSIVTGS